MTQAPSLSPTIANYQAMSKAALIEIIETQKQRVNKECEQRERDHVKIQWYESLLSNKDLPIKLRLTTVAVKKMVEREEPREDGWYRADLTTYANVVGTSPSTVSRGLHGLADFTDVLELRTEEDRHDPRIKILYVRPTDLLDHPQEIAPIGEVKKHGGARERCKCGGEIKTHRHVIRAQEYRQCAKCLATYQIYPAQDVGEELTATADLPFQDERANSADMPDSDFFDVPLQNDMQTFQVPPIANCNAPLSPNDSEHQAAQLLVEIAGTAPKHIKMCKSGDPKYITVQTATTLEDMLAHIRGHETIGAHIRHPFGLTRANCFDADTSEKWGLCLQAARLLDIVGFKVILEPSPSSSKHQGGGHFWVIWDRLVNAYSAQQTLLQYAPILSQVGEYWPLPEGGNRVRLPGGKYVGAGISTWCKLYDAYGVELSHDGAGAACVLLEYQTPSTLVNAYDTPTPALQMHVERTLPATPGGVLGKNDDRAIMAAINDSFSWGELAVLCGGYDRRGYFPAVWRNNQPPNDVHVDPKTDKAKDFGAKAWLDGKPMDRYQVWCFIQGRENWEAFRKRDLAERCKQIREQARRAS